MKKIILSLCLIFSFPLLNAQDLKKYEYGSFIKRGDSIHYRILFPENFNPTQKYPVLFVLHGRGESGSDNEKQLTHGARLFLRDDIRKNFPAIVVFPQCPADSYWANVNITTNDKGKRKFSFVEAGKPTRAMRALQGMVKDFLKKPFLDKKQVYVGGLSMGGMGTYELLRRQRRTFAAAFAICGGDNTNNIKKYQNVPLWIFHGGKDDIVDPAFSMAIAERLKTVGDDVKFTLYPNANHNSWDNAFAEPDLLPWLFGHKR
ncbi:prolyl oligopeptidase family serine peptidase [Pedobacter sp. MR22-3]|uniref:carboxylesterase family protein n=1 Tax=Pedobacter sp. MR22-3 TaxID=2994552 RepID=UPI002246A299|nr:prolyl oligopeptidase family serine peptidase [Pedobacter sp. MR22-3]MCX2583426.1 prolyl oligopeptidase family serine peptidase [Pedobacter sp. MR22-3]